MGLREKLDMKTIIIIFLLLVIGVIAIQSMFGDSITELISSDKNDAGADNAPWKPSAKPVEDITESNFVNPYAGQDSTCVSPQRLIDDECCNDVNANGLCDSLEQFCGNGICSAGENECTCASDCGTCEIKTPTGLCRQNTCQDNQCVENKDPICCGDLICSAQESCSGCFVDCCTLNPARANLGSFPNWAINMDTILGDNSNSINVITAADILTTIALKDLAAGEGKLASEVDLRTSDTIVVGNPCNNPALLPLLADRIYAKQGNCQIFAPGEAIIKIVPTSNEHVALVVAGFSPTDAQRAGRVLKNYSNYDLNGQEFIVGGTHPIPTATKVK